MTTERARVHGLELPDSGPALRGDGTSAAETSGYAAGPKQRVMSAAAAVVLYAVFALIAFLEPMSHDGWYFFGRAKDASPADLVVNLFHNYRHSFRYMNPRIGELFADLTYVFPAAHVLLTPAVFLGMFWALSRLAYGSTARGAKLALGMLVAAACFWACSPALSEALFYRAVTTNYIYGLTLQLLFFVALRDASSRPYRGVATAIGMLVLGTAAGLANEHTGPTAMVVCALLVRRALAIGGFRSLRSQAGATKAWLLTSSAGLVLGYAMLFFAGGQNRRYGGIGKKAHMLDAFFSRGWSGNLELVAELVRQQVPIVAALVVIVLAAWAHRAQRHAVVARLRAARLPAALAFGSALAIALTALVSPIQGPRLYVASAALTTLGALLLLEAALVSQRLRVAVGGVAILTLVGCWATFLPLAHERHGEASERWRALSQAAPGAIVHVKPYRLVHASRWMIADDFLSKLSTDRAAHYFGLGAVEYPLPQGL